MTEPTSLASWTRALRKQLDALGLDSTALCQQAGLDPQLMDDLARNPDSQRTLKDIANRASKRGIRTIAPRVNDAASMTLLFSAGVDYVQGDFLAPAGPEMNYDFS